MVRSPPCVAVAPIGLVQLEKPVDHGSEGFGTYDHKAGPRDDFWRRRIEQRFHDRTLVKSVAAHQELVRTERQLQARRDAALKPFPHRSGIGRLRLLESMGCSIIPCGKAG